MLKVEQYAVKNSHVKIEDSSAEISFGEGILEVKAGGDGVSVRFGALEAVFEVNEGGSVRAFAGTEDAREWPEISAYDLDGGDEAVVEVGPLYLLFRVRPSRRTLRILWREEARGWPEVSLWFVTEAEGEAEEGEE